MPPENELEVRVGEAGSTGEIYASGESFSPESLHQEQVPPSATTPPGFSISVGPVSDKPIPLRKLTAQIVADRLVDLCYDYGDLVSNLRLQKLLYYAQAWYLALHNRPLFRARFEAWIHGPTQPDVYAHFKHFGTGPIERPGSGVRLSPKAEQHLDDVLEAYGSLSAFDLERLAHSELPWKEARGNTPLDEPSHELISTATMKTFYRARLDEQKGEEG